MPGDHGSTFGGNPVACSGALVVLEKLCNENSFDEIYQKGNFVKDILKNQIILIFYLLEVVD